MNQCGKCKSYRTNPPIMSSTSVILTFGMLCWLSCFTTTAAITATTTATITATTTAVTTATPEPDATTVRTTAKSTIETWPSTSLGSWEEQPLPTPELCWNQTIMKRPLSKLPTIAVLTGTPLLSCRAFCYQRYNNCASLAHNEDDQICKLYDSELEWYQYSLDPKYVTEIPINCTYEFAFENSINSWQAAVGVCVGRSGQLASIMDGSQARAVAAVISENITEFWVGTKYSKANQQWEWVNGVAATEQFYFRNHEISDGSDTLCGKGTLFKVSKNRYSVRVVQAACDQELPLVCQYKYGILPPILKEAEPEVPRSEHSFLLQFDRIPTLEPTTNLFFNTTIYIPPVTTQATTQPPPEPKPPTSGPFSTDPAQVGIGAGVSFLGLISIALLVVLDMATIGKEINRLRENLAPCCRLLCDQNDGIINPDDDRVYYHNIDYQKSDLPDYRIPVSKYRDYDQMFAV